MDEKKYGETIRNRRKALGLTQGVLAKALHVSTDYVSRLEKGERTPSARVKIDLDDFVSGKGRFSGEGGALGESPVTAVSGKEDQYTKVREKLSPEKRLLFDAIIKMTDAEAERTLQEYIDRLRRRQKQQ